MVSAITATTKTPTAAELKAAQTRFVALAGTAFPGVPTATVVRTAKMLCTTLGQGASLHDEVGRPAGQVQGQTTAEDLVRAAVGSYCPDRRAALTLGRPTADRDVGTLPGGVSAGSEF